MTDKDFHFLSAPNPQGKGHVGLLRDWDITRPRRVGPKKPAQLLADYFTSLLVLSAEFSIQPVVGQRYFLYYIEDQWSLSLISAAEWNTDTRNESFVGECRLHADMTWSIEPVDDLVDKTPIAAALGLFFDQFVTDVDDNDPLEAGLPFYAGTLRYWQRLLACALSHSVRESLARSGISGMSGSDLLAELDDKRDGLRLLANPKSPT